jgi:hypothetical protein
MEGALTQMQTQHYNEPLFILLAVDMPVGTCLKALIRDHLDQIH